VFCKGDHHLGLSSSDKPQCQKNKTRSGFLSLQPPSPSPIFLPPLPKTPSHKVEKTVICQRHWRILQIKILHILFLGIPTLNLVSPLLKKRKRSLHLRGLVLFFSRFSYKRRFPPQGCGRGDWEAGRGREVDLSSNMPGLDTREPVFARTGSKILSSVQLVPSGHGMARWVRILMI
jgi:hypothetical protein